MRLAGMEYDKPTAYLFLGLGALILLSVTGAVATGHLWLLGAPAFGLLVYQTLVDYKSVFFLLFACIPLSTEIVLPGGFGTDLPTEPLIIGLMLVYGFVLLEKGPNKPFWKHPVTILLLLHMVWMLVTTISAANFVVSLKFLLAKTWYVAVFYFLAGHVLRKEKDVKTLFWVILIPLTVTVLITLIRHAAIGFSFSSVHTVFHPYQRNHVNYAASIALFVPWCYVALKWYRFGWRKWLIIAAVGILLIGVYFSYTRAAYLALVIGAGAYVVLRLRLVKYALLATGLAAIIGFAYLARNNTYLEFAPNYETTISHKNFDNLISATAKGEDISTMERLYRWVAGVQMSQERLLGGFGPGNFVGFYRGYTVTSFQTYVSDNEEQSGIHSYYLMILTEQGIPGLLIFLMLSAYVLIRAENAYHRYKQPAVRNVIVIAFLTTIVIDSFLIINDLIETDKIGSFFFLSMALLVSAEIYARNQPTEALGNQLDR